jgi:hypothetical protein
MITNGRIENSSERIGLLWSTFGVVSVTPAFFSSV